MDDTELARPPRPRPRRDRSRPSSSPTWTAVTRSPCASSATPTTPRRSPRTRSSAPTGRSPATTPDRIRELRLRAWLATIVLNLCRNRVARRTVPSTPLGAARGGRARAAAGDADRPGGHRAAGRGPRAARGPPARPCPSATGSPSSCATSTTCPTPSWPRSSAGPRARSRPRSTAAWRCCEPPMQRHRARGADRMTRTTAHAHLGRHPGRPRRPRRAGPAVLVADDVLVEAGLADRMAPHSTRRSGTLWVAWNGRGVSEVERRRGGHRGARPATRRGPGAARSWPMRCRHASPTPSRAGSPASRGSGSRSTSAAAPSSRSRSGRKALEIPRGEVRPYGWIAAEIGRPKAVRAVGHGARAQPGAAHRAVPPRRPHGRHDRPVLPGRARRTSGRSWPPRAWTRTPSRRPPARGERLSGSHDDQRSCAGRPAATRGGSGRLPGLVPLAAASAAAAGYRPCKVCRPRPSTRRLTPPRRRAGVPGPPQPFRNLAYWTSATGHRAATLRHFTPTRSAPRDAADRTPAPSPSGSGSSSCTSSGARRTSA